MKKHIVLLSAVSSLVIAGSAAAATYTVQKGDWLSTIASKHGLTLKQIKSLNPQIPDINKIAPGDVVNVGDGAGTAATTKAAAKTTAKKETAKPVAKQEAAKPVASSTAPAKASDDTAKSDKKCGDGRSTCDNVINGNPLYRPAANRFYSVTAISTDTKFNTWGLGEEFGYGITDSLSVFLTGLGSTYKFDDYSWDNYGGGLSFRYLNDTNWKGDVYGKVQQNGVINSTDNKFFAGSYLWTAGTKFGYTTCDWTVNGLFEYDYTHVVGSGNVTLDDSPKSYNVGVEGQYAFNAAWNLVASVIYTMPDLSDYNYFSGKLGVNYNIDATKYLGLYAFQNLDNSGKFNDDTGLAIQFGIDF